MNLRPDEINALEDWWIRKSRKNFLAFRRFLRPSGFLVNWFVEDICRKLQKFYLDFRAGRRPILILSTPPQHGKSTAVVDFIAWVIGLMAVEKRSLDIIHAAFSDRLGIRTNLNLRRILTSEKFQKIFPVFQVNKSGHTGEWSRRALGLGRPIGFFRNTTVGGAVTGESLDIGVVDDPLKGRKLAQSQLHRDTIWNWFTDDFYTRFSDSAALLMILTPWHLDDPAHRLQETESSAEWIRYPAIAETDDMHRGEGDALFPKLKPLEFLLKRKKLLTPENWSGLYQQNCVVAGGNKFKLEYFRWWSVLPPLRYKFIVADTASKIKKTSAFTDFQCWGFGLDGCIYLLDHVHKRMEAPELRRKSRDFWRKHNTKRVEKSDPILRAFYIEDKSSGIGLIQELRTKKRDRTTGRILEPVRVRPIPRNYGENKEFRAEDVIPFIEEGLVYLNRDVPDVDVIVDEAVQFPNGVFIDAIDNLMNAVEVAYIMKDDSGNLRAAMEAS